MKNSKQTSKYKKMPKNIQPSMKKIIIQRYLKKSININIDKTSRKNTSFQKNLQKICEQEIPIFELFKKYTFTKNTNSEFV